MKIQIFTSEFHGYMPEKTSSPIFGGQELLLLETAKLLIEEGHDVEVVQLSDKTEKITYQKIKIIKIKSPQLLWLQRLGFIRRWTWAGIIFTKYIDKNADWIHLHNHHFSFPMVFFKNKKQIMTGMNHGVEWDVPWVYESFSLKNYRDRFSFYILRCVSRFSVTKLNKMISNDRFFIHYTTLRLPNLSDKFKYIPNYFDERNFNWKIEINKSDTIVNDVLRFSNGREIVLLPKMAGPDRGTDILIDCVSLGDSWCLVITGVSYFTEHYKKIVKERGLTNNVFFTGHIDYSIQLPQLYKMASIVVIPSPCREATSIALLEGLAMRKPVIAAEIGGLVEIVDNEYNGILCSANKNEFLKRINHLLDNPDFASTLADNGLDTVQKRFTRVIWRKRMLEFFNSNSE
jgi:glycosyltransferase involved in cell wall biosynthesis